MEFLIVTGLSGGGKTQAANFLEDLNYYCVDNMPLALLLPFAEFCIAAQGRFEKVALVTDMRSVETSDQIVQALEPLRRLDCTFRILFIEAPLPVIVRRYQETRRPHPLQARGLTLQEAVQAEEEQMRPVRDRADYIINTGSTSLTQLHREILRLFSGKGGTGTGLPVNVVAFGYKYGIPMDADLVFDVRFLPNPFYVQELRELSGLDQAVFDFVTQDENAREYAGKLTDLLLFQIPLFRREGKSSLTIAVGCTGGCHRSVAMARLLTDRLLEKGQNARLICRDLHRAGDNG